jgi:pyridoxamine 5'-phosphate oxidase
MLASSPHDQFAEWLKVAIEADLKDATAMAVATANGAGRPSVRTVLLKHSGNDGYCWYTDLGSQKAADLEGNNQAELLFYWREFERQVRISGIVETVSEEQADEYFATRPVDSKVAAAASAQSQPVADRDTLETAFEEVMARHPDGEVPRPRSWGGYRLIPDLFEFWQGRESRLHDRFRYVWDAAGWSIERLQP